MHAHTYMYVCATKYGLDIRTKVESYSLSFPFCCTHFNEDARYCGGYMYSNARTNDSV